MEAAGFSETLSWSHISEYSTLLSRSVMLIVCHTNGPVQNWRYLPSGGTRREPGRLSWYSDKLRAGQLWFDSRQGQEIFLYRTVSRKALGPTQPPIQLVPRALSPGVKRPWREADHSPPPTVKVKNGGAKSPLSHTSLWDGA
jgi:hypothetical protein